MSISGIISVVFVLYDFPNAQVRHGIICGYMGTKGTKAEVDQESCNILVPVLAHEDTTFL